MTETSVHDMDALASIAEDDCLYVEAGDGSDFGKVDVSVLRSEMLKQRHGANLQTGTTYTLVLSDAGKVVELANDDPITLTIPANGTVAFPVNTVIEVVQGAAGAVTIEITDDTLNGATSISTEWGSVLLWKRTATEWVSLYSGLTESQVDARFVVLAGLASVNVQTGTSYTIQASDAGKVLVCTNAAAIAVTLPDDLAEFFQFTVVQAGAGVPTVTRSGTDTINGAADGVAPSAQWKGAYFTQYASGAWLALL